MKAYWFDDEMTELPFGAVVLGLCALIASAILWA